MLVSSAVRTVTNLFWVLYFKLVPLNHSHKLLHRQNIFAADIFAQLKEQVSRKILLGSLFSEVVE